MNRKRLGGLSFLAALSLYLTAGVHANEIKAQSDYKVLAPFDIVETKVTTQEGHAIFDTKVRGRAGDTRPEPTGKY